MEKRKNSDESSYSEGEIFEKSDEEGVPGGVIHEAKKIGVINYKEKSCKILTFNFFIALEVILDNIESDAYKMKKDSKKQIIRDIKYLQENDKEREKEKKIKKKEKKERSNLIKKIIKISQKMKEKRLKKENKKKK